MPYRTPYPFSGSLLMAPTWYLAPALVALRDETNRLWPLRSKASDGTIGDARHAGGTSDHNPKPDGRGGLVVDALDLTHDPAHDVDCNILSRWVTVDRRTKYVIWNRQIWNPAVSPHWRPYTGSNPHTKHMHVSIRADLRNDISAWWWPANKEPTVPDDPNVPNITGPLTFHPVINSDGVTTGYYVFSPSTGEVHGHGPGAPYYGRSEDTTPG